MKTTLRMKSSYCYNILAAPSARNGVSELFLRGRWAGFDTKNSSGHEVNSLYDTRYGEYRQEK